MNNKKYYVGVKTDNGMMFVTETDNKNRTSYWNKDSKPLAMSKSVANDIALGLTWNGNNAVVVESIIEQTDHFTGRPTEKQSLINGLSAKEKDDLYRSLWAEHVREDVELFCESEDIDLSENGINFVIEQYVYEGRYDCNCSYWDNIRELVEEAVKTDKV